VFDHSSLEHQARTNYSGRHNQVSYSTGIRKEREQSETPRDLLLPLSNEMAAATLVYGPIWEKYNLSLIQL
jgi:hypothetical protein